MTNSPTSQTLLWLLVLTFGQTYCMDVYFDKYGHCSQSRPFAVDDEEFTVLARGGEAYSTLKCSLSFKTMKKNEELCLKFVRLEIKDCDVALYIYDNKSDRGSLKHKFSCYDQPKHMCSTGRYLTLRLERKSFSSSDLYDFEIIIKEKSQSDLFLEGGFDTFVISIGLIITIIVGVVVLIAVAAIILVCCCCQRKSHKGRVCRQRKVIEGEPFRSQGTSEPLQPSAPPINDMSSQHHNLPGYQSTPPMVPSQIGYPVPFEQPPAYSQVPPPYTQQTEAIPMS